MPPTTSNRLLITAAIASGAILAAVPIALLSGCGGGNCPTMSAVHSVEPQVQSAADTVMPLADDSGTVRPMSAAGPGDMDGDGLATVGDVIKILRFVVGLDQPTPSEVWLANVDGSQYPDPAIDVGDAMKVLQAVVGLEPWPLPWPNGGGPPLPPF